MLCLKTYVYLQHYQNLLHVCSVLDVLLFRRDINLPKYSQFQSVCGGRERKKERERESTKKKFEVKYFMNLYFQDTVRLTEGST